MCVSVCQCVCVCVCVLQWVEHWTCLLEHFCCKNENCCARVLQFFRHGARTPTHPYPTEPYRDAWPQGLGQLTPVSRLHTVPCVVHKGSAGGVVWTLQRTH